MCAAPDCEDTRCAKLAIVGDVMLGRLVSREIASRDPESFWGDTLPLLLGADAVLINLECAISDRGAPWMRTPKVFHFCAAPGAVNVLQAARVRYVSLANNHVLDYGEDALRDTLDLLDDAGITHAGAGETLEQAQQPARFRAKRLAISAFSLTDNEPPFAATSERPGTCYVDSDSVSDPWPKADDIAAERAAGADIVVVSAHLGPNMVTRPSARLRAFKRALVQAGADIIHGHSAHVFQGVEPLGRRVILHDTGDFLDDYAVDPLMRNDWSFVFLLDVDPRGIRRLVLRPVVLNFAEVNLAHGEAFDSICERMSEQSKLFGAQLQRCAEGLELRLNGDS
ncbi:MAG: CapA family protein [Paracoccaceae bacterium]|nr:CapA family protein [Paracoccaceae bacterium]